VAIVAGIQVRRFRLVAITSLVLVLGYRVFLIVNGLDDATDSNANAFNTHGQPLFILFYLLFDGVTLYMLWYYRRRIQSGGLTLGTLAFLVGQTLVFVNPTLAIASFSTTVASVGVLITCFAILQREIIVPLSERSSQVETMHKVSLAITSRISIDTVLDEIAIQAVGWVNADGAAIFLWRNSELILETVYGLPSQLLRMTLQPDEGIAGTIATHNRTIFVENYGRDWHGKADFELARDTFGSTIGVPLKYGGHTLGVLLVVAGQRGRLFGQQDVYLLELLGAQAAVAISHSQLFKEQKQLASELETAHSQLETVLTSTENPVIAVDRNLRLIFANPSAKKLFSIPDGAESRSIHELVPTSVLPVQWASVLWRIRQRSGYVYEVGYDGKVYLCHLAILGRPRIAGWVAVLNDVTQLMELDRFKNEMVRMASHDLKNPLMGAITHLELIYDDLDDITNPDIREALVVIEHQLERMNRIIRGVLDIEKLRADAFISDLCSPLEIIEASVWELKDLIKSEKIVMEVAVDNDLPDFRCNREQFERVLVNLIENAIKFSLVDKRIRVAVYRVRDEVVFQVKDHGVGISDDLQERVFERFFRGQQEGVEHVSGSGLGLSLVKTIVERHGGRVWLESQVGDGTTFFVAVPRA
jgi:signal transduction histidine kinase/GAF domain-containing protein